MITEYVHAALKNAKYEILDDHSFYGEIPECNGVYANSDTLEACREELQAVLEEWILFRIHRNLSLPVIPGLRSHTCSPNACILSYGVLLSTPTS